MKAKEMLQNWYNMEKAFADNGHSAMSIMYFLDKTQEIILKMEEEGLMIEQAMTKNGVEIVEVEGC